MRRESTPIAFSKEIDDVGVEHLIGKRVRMTLAFRSDSERAHVESFETDRISADDARIRIVDAPSEPSGVRTLHEIKLHVVTRTGEAIPTLRLGFENRDEGRASLLAFLAIEPNGYLDGRIPLDVGGVAWYDACEPRWMVHTRALEWTRSCALERISLETIDETPPASLLPSPAPSPVDHLSDESSDEEETILLAAPGTTPSALPVSAASDALERARLSKERKRKQKRRAKDTPEARAKREAAAKRAEESAAERAREYERWKKEMEDRRWREKREREEREERERLKRAVLASLPATHPRPLPTGFAESVAEEPELGGVKHARMSREAAELLASMSSDTAWFVGERERWMRERFASRRRSRILVEGPSGAAAFAPGRRITMHVMMCILYEETLEFDLVAFRARSQPLTEGDVRTADGRRHARLLDSRDSNVFALRGETLIPMGDLVLDEERVMKIDFVARDSTNGEWRNHAIEWDSSDGGYAVKLDEGMRARACLVRGYVVSSCVDVARELAAERGVRGARESWRRWNEEGEVHRLRSDADEIATITPILDDWNGANEPKDGAVDGGVARGDFDDSDDPDDVHGAATSSGMWLS